MCVCECDVGVNAVIRATFSRVSWKNAFFFIVAAFAAGFVVMRRRFLGLY